MDEIIKRQSANYERIVRAEEIQAQLNALKQQIQSEAQAITQLKLAREQEKIESED